MFRELVDLARQLRSTGVEDQLPEVGFYRYKKPIRWVVHLWPGNVYIEKAELPLPRPFDGRTSAIRAHPLVDEAGYALGTVRQAGKQDRRAIQKHQAFRELAEKVADNVHDPHLKEAIRWLLEALGKGLIAQDPRFVEIESKDWVSFVAGEGPLKGQHLYLHPEVVAFWAEELAQRKGSGLQGECAVCGTRRYLSRTIPQVRVTKSTMPIQSLNAEAFVSFIGGAEADKRAYLRLCFACGEEAAAAFNYLSESSVHRRNLATDHKAPDGLGNLVALFWLRAPAPLKLGEEVLDPVAIQSRLGESMGGIIDAAPEADPRQVITLLNVPWRPHAWALTLDDYAFYLAVVSPNVGRVVLREWVTVSLQRLRDCLRAYLQTLSLPPVQRPPSISEVVDALESGDPNLARALLRTAFLGNPPPREIKLAASSRLRTLIIKGQDERQQEVLVSVLNLAMFHGRKEGNIMISLEDSPAYLCGRLLAVLEEVQRLSHWKRTGQRLKTTIVPRFYGTASSAPAAAFATLLRLATTAHLPDAGGDLNRLVEEIASRLKGVGGFPAHLNPDQQAEFHLGFFSQRAELRAKRESRQEEQQGPEGEEE